jgi:hypothetical protein
MMELMSRVASRGSKTSPPKKNVVLTQAASRKTPTWYHFTSLAAINRKKSVRKKVINTAITTQKTKKGFEKIVIPLARCSVTPCCERFGPIPISTPTINPINGIPKITMGNASVDRIAGMRDMTKPRDNRCLTKGNSIEKDVRHKLAIVIQLTT